MFFIDKYSPKSVDEAYFHKESLGKLQTMSKDDAIPHIIFYGPEGSGKKTIINIFLEMLYDKYVHQTVNSVYNVTGSGNTVTEVMIKQSNYHIIIEPNNNNFDRYLIQDVVKEYARRVPLGVFTANKIFKTVLINNIDNMSYYAQTSLRRTLELYSGTCRFIMWSRSLSKVIGPLRSRCHCFSICSPTNKELFGNLLNISYKENINISLEQYTKILDLSEGNIKTSLWLLQLSKLNETFDTTYSEAIRTVIDLLLSFNLKSMNSIRDIIYNIMITNITGTQIIKDIVDKLLINDQIPYECKVNITELAAESENNLIKGRREIIHLEAFIAGVMNSLYKNTELYNNNNKKLNIKLK
jgi:replication factor C subunit 3/5